MHLAELTPPEQRVLGCLIEKRWTTPDQYPLSLNGLRLACNQSTNRDPVTQYDEATVRDAAQRLSRYGLARLASGHGSRATKYRHLAEEALGLGREELAVLAVLLLRGPQTPGELKARSERLAKLDSLADVERVLSVLAERGYGRRIERRPGQKEDRFEQLMGPHESAYAAPAPGAGAPAPGYGTPPAPDYGTPPAPDYGTPPASDYGTPPASDYGTPPAPATTPGYATAPAPASAHGHSTDHGDAVRAGEPRERQPANGNLAERLAALEAEVAALRAELSALRDVESPSD